MEAESVIFTMRVLLPLDASRTGINRMVHACADIIMHLGDNGLAAARKLYVQDPFGDGDTVIGEWSIGPDPEPAGTATYAFTQHEIATIRTALRLVAPSDVAELTRDELSALHERLNPLDAVS